MNRLDYSDVKDIFVGDILVCVSYKLKNCAYNEVCVIEAKKGESYQTKFKVNGTWYSYHQFRKANDQEKRKIKLNKIEGNDINHERNIDYVKGNEKIYLLTDMLLSRLRTDRENYRDWSTGELRFKDYVGLIHRVISKDSSLGLEEKDFEELNSMTFGEVIDLFIKKDNIKNKKIK